MGLSWVYHGLSWVYHGVSPTCPIDPPANGTLNFAARGEALGSRAGEQAREDVCFLLM